MNHIVRSAAQLAMEDPGLTKIEAVMRSTASRNFELAQSSPTEIHTNYHPISLSADRFCGCPDQPETEVACSTVCTGTVPTFIYYKMSAAKDFAGIIVPTIPLQATAQVQAR
jgi:pilus assembly protein CpaE